jgi:hypothetical protein
VASLKPRPLCPPAPMPNGMKADWEDPRAGLDTMVKRKILPLTGIWPRPVSPSLYRLLSVGEEVRYVSRVRLGVMAKRNKV